MNELRQARIWYLLEWNDRDKCLLFAIFFGLLQLCYWLLVNLIANETAFGRHYVSHAGLALSQWVFLACVLVWVTFAIWGAWLRHQQLESRLYVDAFLYSFSLPLLAMGHMIGLYNPVLGVMLLGAGLTGVILFDFKRVLGPFLLAVAIIALLAWLTVEAQLDYAPLLRLDPVSKFHVSGPWIVLMIVASTPFTIGVFLVTYLLLSRWHEREAMVRLLSNTDTLTGLPNRRSLFPLMERELQRAKRSGEPMALAMMDLDHFKQVNDTWGHAAGDAVLTQLGDLLPRLLRSVDLLGRVGGEEFIIMLPNTDATSATRVIERCRAAIEDTPVPLADGRILNITASFGLYLIDRVAVEASLQDVLAQADRALYRAKQDGRNKVEIT